MQPVPVVMQDADGDAEFLCHRVGFSPVQVFGVHIVHGVYQRQCGLLARQTLFLLMAQQTQSVIEVLGMDKLML